jgi:hypothetical protein
VSLTARRVPEQLSQVSPTPNPIFAMAAPNPAHERADVPGAGGYTRFELELEVRPLFRRRHVPLACFD